MKKVFLNEDEMPRQWYNIIPDLPAPLPPPLGPDGNPAPPEAFAPIFPMPLLEQEMSPQRWWDIPDEVMQVYAQWRPTPLYRAEKLEEYLGTPAKIYYKNEGVSPAGSHKPNTSVPQTYYNKISGTKRITTETGAGQWGSALAYACAQYGLEGKVFMVRISFDQKPYRKLMMQTWGANCVPSPSEETKAGRDILAKDPNSPGSLGIAISEAVEQAVADEDTKYSLGSVLNHVLLHQTINGEECLRQFEKIGDFPDIVIGCAGGGSNFAGCAFPFVREKLGGKDITIIAAEPTSCPTMTRGPYAYDHGDTAGYTPLLAMHTLGHDFVPAPIHAGGLRYHGMAPLVSLLVKEGVIEARAYDQIATFEAGITWARTEGFISAPETNHALAAVIQEANSCKVTGQPKTILVNWSGHGLVDLAAYEAFLSGKLTRYELPVEEIERALKAIENFPKP